MPLYFLDSSALVKRYVQEAGTPRIQRICADAGSRVCIATITAAEVAAAITRRVRGGSLDGGRAASLLDALRLHLASEYITIQVTDQVVMRAMDVAWTHGLRGYDAVQLACAATLRANGRTPDQMAVTLVSADAELNAAATLEGFSVVDPNTDGSL